MKRLLVDMDGVLANVYEQFIAFEKEKLGITRELSELVGKMEDEAFEDLYTYVNTKDFFTNVLPMAGSIDTLEKLNAKYELFIVSAATEFPLSLTEKMLWLKRYFPFIHWKQVVLCGTKEIVSGDIMIDDHFKNLDTFKGQTILFSQPHNMNRDIKDHIRVENWNEVAALLL
ncbi:MAG: 5'(3')-deoxyribonucleotidase [Pedobacter sp.]|nr:MAG: 5'(3')-deoxyribonucleotidase [Pedobacter sp.]